MNRTTVPSRVPGAALFCLTALISSCLLLLLSINANGNSAKTQDSKPSDSKTQEPKPQAPAPKPQEKPAETKPPEVPAKPGATSPILTVKLALMADPRVFLYDFDVEVRDGVVLLSGKVSNDMEKSAAAEVAQSVEGVKSVTNNVEVVKDLQRALARKRDEAITQYVKDRFAKSKTLESTHFDVRTEDGIVYLSGKTRFQVIVLEAAEAARQVPGVRAVKTEGIRIEAGE